MEFKIVSQLGTVRIKGGRFKKPVRTVNVASSLMVDGRLVLRPGSPVST
jgi:hypothetical protein